jgi:uncharacterized protein YkwD
VSRAASRARLRSLVAIAAVAACGATLALAAGTASAVTVPPIDPGSILPGLPLGGGKTGSCPGARHVPAGMAHRRARAVILCAINRARKSHGLPIWTPIRPLRLAAGRHAADMARRHYFAHVSLGGSGPLARLHRAGWSGSAYGEALAWGCGGRASPRATVRGWLHSPVHRAILLSPLYRQAGIGIADRAPGGCRGGTWVLDAAR